MCAEYKVQVNDKNITEAHPLPCFETIFSKVTGANFFMKIYLSNSYWQIPLDENSQVCTLNITRGLFRVTRLQQGLKNGAAIFQLAIEEVLKKLDGCVAYQDDILLIGVTEAELRKRYNFVKERLVAKNFTVNENKCVSFSTMLSFLGYEVSTEDVKPEQKHVPKLLHLMPPKDVKEVEAFIGLINYFGQAIPNYAAISEPLVQPYTLDNEVTLTTNASEKTIGFVLTQNDHPVI